MPLSRGRALLPRTAWSLPECRLADRGRLIVYGGSVATRGGRSFWLNNRRVIVRTGTRSQTVNVCTRQNVLGKYEAVYRLPILSAIEAADVPEVEDLHALETWLVETRNALPEGPSGQPVVRSAVGTNAVDEAWLRGAVEKVEQAVDRLVDDFAQHPYRHRVEHSLHLQLFRALADHQPFDELKPVGTSSLLAGLIHKEWPETLPGKGANQRGLFDLAVLAPSQLAQATIDQYRQGRIHAPIVVEVGLDYGRGHLEQDLVKLRNSKVPYAYVVHFSRLPASGAVEDLITASHPNIRIAYAHVPPKGGRAVKHLAETDITRAD
jgi:hypothetical protein